MSESLNFITANSYYKDQDYIKAIDFYKLVILELANNNIELELISRCYYNMGTSYIKLKNYTKAINNFEKALEWQYSYNSLLNLAYSYALIDNKYRALHLFKECLKQNPLDKSVEKSTKLIETHIRKQLIIEWKRECLI